jgi:Zn-dependent peptidase ImmA (M78 family)
MFQENVEYTGILRDIMTKQTRRRLLNEISLAKGDKSYTINKENIFMCLKDENNKYYDDNMLIYVLLHELAHVLNHHDVGHTEMFHTIFDALLDKATEMKIYDPSIPLVRNYCLYNDN